MHHKVTDGIYSVGVLNPNMRIFDVILYTDYGTSYNSFIVKGEKKTALIETSHNKFDHAFIENIKEVVDLKEIDYIVLNHNEPDHSGALGDLLKYTPNAKVVLSQAGSLYINEIVNRDDFKKIVVKDGDSIDLGGKTMEFFNVPLVHWPDTMFTWIKEDKALFSCDFLGCHYCEPLMFDSKIIYKEEYKESLKEYFDAIMSPFKPAVRKGLDVIKDFDIEFACVSHGPILTKKGLLPYALDKYKKWSAEEEKPAGEKEIAIIFGSAYGNTQLAAEEIGRGIVERFKKDEITANVHLYNINDYELEDLQEIINQSHGFLVGSCTINRNAVPPIWQLLSGIDVINSRNKPVGAFGSYGWSGEAVGQLNSFMKNQTLKVTGEGFRFKFVPSEKDLKDAFDFGNQFVEEGFSR